MELHCAHRLSDERVIVLIWASLNDGDAERSIVFFETRCQDTACEPAAQDEVVGHDKVKMIRNQRSVNLELSEYESMELRKTREDETTKW